MKSISRIATAVTTAIVATVASILVAAPALAAEAGDEKFNPAADFSTPGAPLQVWAILICGAILLIVVLVLAQLIGNLFNKKQA